MAVQPRLSYVTTAEGRLAYHVVGDGQAGCIVWSQWVAQHLDLLWTDPSIEAMLSGLARDDLTSILVQPRGTGLSDPGSRVASAEEQAADLLAILDAERVERATIGAFSGVALPAMLLAAQHPRRVRALSLYGAPLTGPLVDDAADGWTPQSARACVQTWRRAGETWGSGEVLRAWDEALCSPYNLRVIAMAERCSVSQALGREYTEMSLSVDFRPIAGQIRVPTRILGRPDNACPLETMRALADAIPDASYHELPPSRPGDSIGESFVPVARHMAELTRGDDTRYGGTERVLATVLFTDIVGSTEALAQAGDAAWAATLAEYHRVVRREAAGAGGRLVNTIGDGTLCELPAPAAALRAGQAICRAGRPLGVETRAGVHVGECERLGDDLAGMAVHVGARVSSLAGPGEVLVSRTVRDLVAGSDLVLDPRGEHELKGVPGSWEVFCLRDGDAPPTPAPVLAPQPTGVDRMVMQLARRSPGAMRRLNQLGNAVQRRSLSGRR